MGGGVCGAIFEAAGKEELQAACDKLAPIHTGEAVMTPGFWLPARYVIHTAGPVYRDGKSGEEELLQRCYRNSFILAAEKGCESIAFPLISSGIYGYPPTEAFRVAVNTIKSFLQENDISVYLCVFDKLLPVIGEETRGRIDRYIENEYKLNSNKNQGQASRSICEDETALNITPAFRLSKSSVKAEISSLVIKLDESFSEKLLCLIDEKGKSDVEVYKRANIDRKLFSKIRTNKDYTPRKRTVIALAVSLELSLQETIDLLKRAGYTLSHSCIFDIIVEFFIANANYDIFEINETLFRYDQQLLGV
jgi:O-acetyl-ADP-ribose deacetylase (regulator of RNase III)